MWIRRPAQGSGPSAAARGAAATLRRKRRKSEMGLAILGSGRPTTEGENRGGGRVTETTGFVDVDGGGADFTVLVNSRYLVSGYLS